MESLEDVAMNGSKMEEKARKAERKRLRDLEELKKKLQLNRQYDDMPIEATDIVEIMLGMVEGLKDPMIKKLLGKNHKQAVNSFIDSVTAVKAAAVVEVKDTMAKI
jgi:hypothetical protein